MKRSGRFLSFFVLAVLFVVVNSFNSSAHHVSNGLSGIAAVPCSNIIMFQGNPVTQKDVTGWVQKLVAEVNKSALEKTDNLEAPQVELTPDLLWFGTLLYCGLDPSQPLVKASLRLIDAEWDKLKEGTKKDL